MPIALGGKGPVHGINVTPLIDVVLVLLIIFMVLTPLAEKQMFMRVPQYEPQAQPVPPEMVPPDQTVLVLKANGRVELNSRDESLAEAMAYLHAAYDGRLSRVLFFNAEDGVKYETAVKVLDLAHQAGVNTIGMMTDAPRQAP
ncbi:MAG TPA: biopolymer transporter ExbD [Anaeromyxobacteraceae bacterium]|nr:biopolymer transporter ExbD [Anaeromyxobacteraceae bacterium]